MNKIDALKQAREALDNLQQFTRDQLPVGTEVLTRRGRGIAIFKVVAYPEADSIEAAQSVVGRSSHGKNQVINAATIVSRGKMPSS